MSARSEVVEVITRGERRRVWSVEQKHLIVTEAMQPGATAAEVVRRWGIGTGLLYTWRKQLLSGELGEPAVPAPAFAQVTLARPVQDDEAPPTPPAATTDDAPGGCAGRMEILLPGGTVLRVGADVDAGALRRVLAVLAAA